MRLKNYKIYLMHNDAAGKVKKEENVKKIHSIALYFSFWNVFIHFRNFGERGEM